MRRKKKRKKNILPWTKNDNKVFVGNDMSSVQTSFVSDKDDETASEIGFVYVANKYFTVGVLFDLESDHSDNDNDAYIVDHNDDGDSKSHLNCLNNICSDSLMSYKKL